MEFSHININLEFGIEMKIISFTKPIASPLYLYLFLKFGHHFCSTTVRTGIIGPDSRTLELPLLVWSGSFFFFFCLKLGLRRSLFAVRSPPYPREGISNVLARGPIIPVSTVAVLSRVGIWNFLLLHQKSACWSVLLEVISNQAVIDGYFFSKSFLESI